MNGFRSQQVAWYTERAVTQLSLGGLLILVVIRTIQYNMLKMRDKYLHTNCLAALANMSAQFKGLHPYVAQRIVSLFETLARKHARLVDGLQGVEADTDTGEDGFDEVSEAVQCDNLDPGASASHKVCSTSHTVGKQEATYAEAVVEGEAIPLDQGSLGNQLQREI